LASDCQEEKEESLVRMGRGSEDMVSRCEERRGGPRKTEEQQASRDNRVVAQ
jgi:hypothetical protein